MDIVFFGTPSFSAQLLEFLLKKDCDRIVAVVTQPDRPQGRHGEPAPPAVKTVARTLCPEIPVLQPMKASDPEFLRTLRVLRADLFLVVAYGQILPQSLLDIPLLGCINVHTSLLPKYRGAAPIRRCLMDGEKETGVSIQRMVFQLDAGDIIDDVKVSISENLLFGELEQLLCDAAKPLLMSVLSKYRTGVPLARPQDASLATYAAKIRPEESEIHWTEDARYLHNRIRALSPRPGAWCWVTMREEKKRLKILRSEYSHQTGMPGQFWEKELLVSARGGSLRLLEVQLEGKRPMSAANWLRGCSVLQFDGEPLSN